MARLRYCTGFETGGLEEANQGLGGSPSVQSTTVRNGTYALSLPAATSTWFDILIDDRTLPTNLTNKVALCFYFKLTGFPSTGNVAWFAEMRAGAGGQVILLKVDENGNVILEGDSGVGVLATGSEVLSTTEWNEITVVYEIGATGSGSYWVRVNGVTDITGTDGDHSGNSVPYRILLWGDPDAGSAHLIDDVLLFDNVTNADPFSELPTSWRVDAVRGDSSSTTSGDTLDIGSWGNTGEVPFNSTNIAEYTASNVGGDVLTDGTGGNTGPNGFTDTILGCTYVGELFRGNGGSTTHSLRMGSSASSDFTDVEVTINATSAPGDAFMLTHDGAAANCPTDSEYARIGMHTSGARDIAMVDGLVHVALDTSPAGGAQQLRQALSPFMHNLVR